MDKNYIIYGLGISGIACAKYLLENKQKIILTDDNALALERCKMQFLAEELNLLQIVNSQEIAKFCNENTIIIFAPGIPLYFPQRHNILNIAKDSGAKLICDLELYYLLNNQINGKQNFIGITGTNGKSTITALVNFIFQKLEIPTTMAGNIGVAAFTKGPKNHSVNNHIFEVSSYQIDLIDQMHFDIVALSNITPDHIDRHKTFENYIAVKKKIFTNRSGSQNKRDFAIIGIDNDYSYQIFQELENDNHFHSNLVPISTKKIVKNGVSIIDGQLYNNIQNANYTASLDNMILRGDHNMQNIAIAFSCVYCYCLKHNLNYSNQIIAAIKEFKGLRHRMQLLGQIDGINFINDSKATNAESSENALKSYDHIFWILGGKPKEGGINSLTGYFNKITKAYLIGQASEEFALVLAKNNVVFEKCGDLETAIEKSFFDAKNSSLKEKNILLSPACASFDQWKSFEERGDYFCKAFDEIKAR